MTTPDTKMLNTEERAIERLNEFAAGERGPYTNIVSDIKTSIDHISVLTTRVAELERERQFTCEAHRNEVRKGGSCVWCQLAAARAPVGDSEIAELLKTLDVHRGQMTDAAADLIARLARERDEARDKAYYAKGTTELALQHRDNAETSLATLRAQVRPMLEEIAAVAFVEGNAATPKLGTLRAAAESYGKVAADRILKSTKGDE